jgi:predicted phosphodiesterase
VKAKNDSDFLMLAGDIGKPGSSSYATFLREVAPYYDKVFVITGNHEYYRMPFANMNDLDDKCREICAAAGDNVVFLQNERYDICDWLSVYGGTFWTDIPVAKRSIIESSINDYTHIPGLTANMTSALHAKTVNDLEREIENAEPTREWVVMSHHMPSMILIDDKYKTPSAMDINYAFASDINIAKDHRIRVWVYGHTHMPRVSGKFHCNSIGYPGEDKRDWRNRIARYFVVEKK